MRFASVAALGLILAAAPALAQQAQPEQSPRSQTRDVAPPSAGIDTSEGLARSQAGRSEGGAEERQRAGQQASLPAGGEFDDMLGAVRDSGKIGRQIDAMGPQPQGKVEIRDAYRIERGAGQGDALRQALDDNRQNVDDLRRSLIRNKSVDRALSRDQVPIGNVVAANVERDGRIVVYAYPQSREVPR